MFGTADRAVGSGASIRGAITWIGGIALTGLVVWLLHDELLLVFLAVLLAVSLRGAADRVAQHSPLSPHWAMAVIMILILLFTIGFWMWVGPQLVQQGHDLVTALSNEGAHLAARYGNTQWGKSVMQKVNGSGSEAARSLAASAWRSAQDCRSTRATSAGNAAPPSATR